MIRSLLVAVSTAVVGIILNMLTMGTEVPHLGNMVVWSYFHELISMTMTQVIRNPSFYVIVIVLVRSKNVGIRGGIDDCSTDVPTVEAATLNYFLPVVKNLTQKNFFKYFKVC